MPLICTNANSNYFEKIEVRGGLFSFWSNIDELSTMNEIKALAHNEKVYVVGCILKHETSHTNRAK
jgi:hypothetical protein